MPLSLARLEPDRKDSVSKHASGGSIVVDCDLLDGQSRRGRDELPGRHGEQWQGERRRNNKTHNASRSIRDLLIVERVALEYPLSAACQAAAA
jgi:hypothetical protein